jgi:RHS repeat-associated protein
VYNKTVISEVVNQGTVETNVTTFTYDLSKQLINEHRSDTMSGNSFNTTFLYDGMGNRLWEIDQANGITTYTYDVANQLLVTKPLTGYPTTHFYDNNGNLTLQNKGGALTTYTWDQENRLTTMVAHNSTVTTTYIYSDEGHRQTTISGSDVTRYVWDDDVVLMELDTGDGQTQYTQGPGEWGLLISQHNGTTVGFLGADNRSNVRLIIPMTGAGGTYNYKAFGEVLSNPGILYTPFQYAGSAGYYAEYPATPDVEFYRTLHRIYRFHSGRFPQPDPLGFEGGDWNLYGYAENNPVSNFDPTGMAPQGNPFDYVSGFFSGMSGRYGTERTKSGLAGEASERAYERFTLPLGNWTDKYLLGSSINNWGFVQGKYDSGKATIWQLAPKAISGVAQTVFLATSILDGAAFAGGFVRYVAKNGILDIAPKLYTKFASLYEEAGHPAGLTDEFGNIEIDRQRILAGGLAVRKFLIHELVHRFFTVKGSGIIPGIRRVAGTVGYTQLELLRYIEEATAETKSLSGLVSGVNRNPRTVKLIRMLLSGVASGTELDLRTLKTVRLLGELKAGLDYPLAEDYGINRIGILKNSLSYVYSTYNTQRVLTKKMYGN